MPLISRFAAFAATILLFSATVFSQGSNSGGIRGTVQDKSGAVIAGATITMTSQATGAVERSLTTDAQGNYTATLIQPGTYRMEVTATGFRKYSSMVTIGLDQITREDITLGVGAANEVVEVQGAGALVNTENATTG